MTLKRFSATSTLRKDQAGQALVLGMFMILAGLLGLYFMFNAGQSCL
jgi:hypothetical protein